MRDAPKLPEGRLSWPGPPPPDHVHTYVPTDVLVKDDRGWSVPRVVMRCACGALPPEPPTP